LPSLLPATLITITIALAALALALFVARHHRCRRNCPLRCHCYHRCRHLPTTLIAITIALFVAVAVHLPAILVAIAIALLPSPSSSSCHPLVCPAWFSQYPLLRHCLSLRQLVVMLPLIVPPSHLTWLIVGSHLVAITITHPSRAATPPSIALLLQVKN
jgi:hypothetical protein